MRELRRVSPGLRGLRAALMLKLGLIPSFSPYPLVRPEGLRRIQFDQFPIESRADLQPSIDETIASGLTLKFCYQILPENEFNRLDVARAVAFLSPDQRFWAVLGWARVQRSVIVRQRTAFLCRSLLTSGEVLMTVSRPPMFDQPVNVRVEHHARGSPRQIIGLHHKRLAALNPDAIVPVADADLERMLVLQAQGLIDALSARGLLVPFDPRRV
jgi:hypothetical protein